MIVWLGLIRTMYMNKYMYFVFLLKKFWCMEKYDRRLDDIWRNVAETLKKVVNSTVNYLYCKIYIWHSYMVLAVYEVNST